MTILSVIPLATCLGWGLVCGLLWSYRACLRETTLTGPHSWLMAFAMAMGVMETLTVLGVARAISTEQEWSLLAGNLGLCPTIALLGAKRPQSRAWFWIVLSFWVVLSLPAVESLLFQHWIGSKYSVTRLVLPWCVLGLGIANYLGTVHGWRSLVFHGAVALVVHRELFPHGDVSAWHGLDGIAHGLPPWTILVTLVGRRVRGVDPSLMHSDIDEARLIRMNRIWFRFRDAYGVAWGLRVIERLNTQAIRGGLPWRWTWHGLERRNGMNAVGLPTDQRTIVNEDTQILQPSLKHMERSLHALLSRFARTNWKDSYNL